MLFFQIPSPLKVVDRGHLSAEYFSSSGWLGAGTGSPRNYLWHKSGRIQGNLGKGSQAQGGIVGVSRQDQDSMIPAGPPSQDILTL